MTTRILAVDDSSLILKLIHRVLTPVGYEVVGVPSGSQALARVDEIQPHLIISDVMMPDMSGYELCQKLRQKPLTANTPIMMLTSLSSLENKIQGFEAGADDYVVKPFESSELRARVEVLLRRAPDRPAAAQTSTGKIIAVFSLRGGVGVSTIAANLAVALTQLWGNPAVLVDLALTAGQAALMLNLSLRHSWADLAAIPVEEIHSDLLDNVLLQHSSGTRVLAAPRRPEDGELLTAPKIAHTLRTLAKDYQYLVLDLPHDFADKSLAGLDEAQQILTIMAPELGSVRVMASTLDVFGMLEYPEEKLRVVLNHTLDRHALTRDDIERVLRQSINLEIEHDSDKFVEALNKGIPPTFKSPHSGVGALLEDYAYQISKEEHKNAKPESPTDAWRRATRRLERQRGKR